MWNIVVEEASNNAHSSNNLLLPKYLMGIKYIPQRGISDETV
jgi:hypothetical protein